MAAYTPHTPRATPPRPHPGPRPQVIASHCGSLQLDPRTLAACYTRLALMERLYRGRANYAHGQEVQVRARAQWAEVQQGGALRVQAGAPAQRRWCQYPC